MRFRYLAGLSLAVALAAPAATPAQQLGTSVAGGVSVNNNHWSLGYFFDVYAPFTVTQLAFWDEGGNGFSQGHDIGLLSADGLTTISSASIAAGTGAPLLDGFRLVDVAPFTLGIGTYQVTGTTGDELYNYGGILTNAFGITYTGSSWCQSEVVVGNCGFDEGNNGYFGANFAGSSVPEPASMVLLGTGLVGLYGAARRRRGYKQV